MAKSQETLKLTAILRVVQEDPEQCDMGIWCLMANEARHQLAWNRGAAVMRLPQQVRQLALWN